MLRVSKVFEKLNNSVFPNSDTFFHDVDSNIITFLSADSGFITTDLNKINLVDDNFNEEDPKTIIHVRLSLTKLRRYVAPGEYMSNTKQVRHNKDNNSNNNNKNRKKLRINLKNE